MALRPKRRNEEHFHHKTRLSSGNGDAVGAIKVVHSKRSRQAGDFGVFEATAAVEIEFAAIPSILST
jgi:hypothetical protein